MTRALDREEGELVVLDEATSDLVVDAPVVPVVLDGAAQALYPALCSSERHDRVKVATEDEDAPVCGALVLEELLVDGDHIVPEGLLEAEVHEYAHVGPLGRLCVDGLLHLRLVEVLGDIVRHLKKYIQIKQNGQNPN